MSVNLCPHSYQPEGVKSGREGRAGATRMSLVEGKDERERWRDEGMGVLALQSQQVGRREVRE